ncbi:MAG: N-acetyltransferase [Halioglobus sp.]|nr:N-acetyltransferase [Halioglobus sp.]
MSTLGYGIYFTVNPQGDIRLSISIRKEQPRDAQNIHEVTVAAFLDAPHTDNTEQYIVKALRESGALSISLVAEDEGSVVGHVALSPVTISDSTDSWYGLGPISVLPNKQGKGIGSKLMNAAIQELKNIKAKGCVLLGDPNYYHRFGFKPRECLVLPGVPPEYFQAMVFHGDLPQGSVTYHESFSAKG